MIVLCHVMSYLGYTMLGQFFNVGVPVFLLISGYLYGNKDIKNYKKWYIQRTKKILLPYYIFVIFILVISLNSGGMLTDIIFLLNLRGITFLFDGIIQSDLAYPELTHLWFLTVIMLCYLLVILVKKINIRIDNSKKFVKFISLGIVLVIVTAYLRIRLNYIFIFFIGYFLSQCNFRGSRKSFSILTICMLFGIGIRLIGNHYVDGTILYDFIIVGFTHDMLAIWIFYFIKVSYKYFDRIHMINRLATKAEGLTYYIYITHHVFLHGVLCVDQISSSIPLQLICFLFFTYISAKILKYIEQRILFVFA